MSLKASFKGRRVLITGGARGIGFSIAKKFLEAGATVTILDQDKVQLQEVKRTHPSMETVFANLLYWEESRAILESLGEFHHLVNNAGIARPAEKLMDVKPESISEYSTSTLKGW
jgi:short-subunit dehydrogenase involved in D-alanine esterification of teichoic acids